MAQLVITTNESHKSIAIHRGGKRPTNVYVVRSGPDFARLRIREPSRQWFCGRQFLVVYLGEICTQDGVEHLVRAMRILRHDLGRNDVHCVLMGGGPHQLAVARYAKEIGVGDLCTFTGIVSDEVLCQVLSSADIGVDPCPKNAWSDKSTMNKVGEYMFFGLPVVAYDLRETRVSAGEAGLYADPNDEVALAADIAHLLDDPNARQRMGRIAQQQVRDSLGWSHSEPILLAAYNHAFSLRSTGVLSAIRRFSVRPKTS